MRPPLRKASEAEESLSFKSKAIIGHTLPIWDLLFGDGRMAPDHDHMTMIQIALSFRKRLQQSIAHSYEQKKIILPSLNAGPDDAEC